MNWNPARDWQDWQKVIVKYWWKKALYSYNVTKNNYNLKRLLLMCSTSESSNWMVKLWWFVRFQLWVVYLVFIAFVPLFSPAMWHKSRLLSSPDGIKTKHLKRQQRLYGSWVDFILQFSKTKQNFRFYETNVHVCEKNRNR